MKNLLLTNMSTLHKEPRRSKYCGEFVKAQDITELRYCYGVGQLEAGTKYFLSKVRIDGIIVIGTEATAQKTHICQTEGEGIPKAASVDGEDAVGEISADDFYVSQILKFVREGEAVSEPTDDAEVFMAPLAENRNLRKENFCVIKDVAKPHANAEFEVDNVQGIVNAILNWAQDEEIRLYIDMQGGIRTSGYVRNAVLSILGNERGSKVKIEEIIATEFGAPNVVNRIVNETKRYKIMDLAAAMNSFVRYGKVDLLKSYCKERRITAVDANADESAGKPLGRLLWLMEKVDDSVSLCNVSGLKTAIDGMKSLFAEQGDSFNVYGSEQTDDEVFVKSVFEILKEGIRRDYGSLLTTEGDEYIVELISWCTRKGFIQQALTLVEDKMPTVFLKNKTDNSSYILAYEIVKNEGESDEEASRRLEKFAKKKIGENYYEVANNLFYRLIFCYKNCEDTVQKKILERITALTSVESEEASAGDMTDKTFHAYFLANQISIPTQANGKIQYHKMYQLKRNHSLKNELKGRTFTQSNKESFRKAYCNFRVDNNMCNTFVFPNVNRNDAESLYRFLMEHSKGTNGMGGLRAKWQILRESYQGEEPYFTIVNSVVKDEQGNAKAIPYIGNKNGASAEAKIKIHFNYEGCKKEKDDNTVENEPECLRRLDNLLRLHDALKKERNCANHADDKEIRLSASVVKRALEVYIEEARAFVSRAE